MQGLGRVERRQPGIVGLEVEVERPIWVLASHAARRVHGQRGLAHPGHALDDPDPRPVARSRHEQAEFLIAADEVDHLRGQRVRRRGPAELPAGAGETGGAGQFGIVAEHPLMQLSQRGPRLGALFVDELATGVPVQAECLSRPAAAVQSGHLVRDERLVQRVLGQQVAELTDHVGVPAEVQLTLDPFQNRRPPLFLQAGPHPGHPVAADPGEWLAAPQPVRLAEQ